MKRDFLSLNDLAPAELVAVLDRADALKAERGRVDQTGLLAGRNVGMLFNKPSVRTRVSFEIGIQEMGGRVVFMQEAETQLSKREPLGHAARVFSRYLDALVIRTFAQADLVEMAGQASIPVINALTDDFHPCQLLADLMTVREKKGRLNNLKIAWVGDGNNMSHSWLNAAALLGFDLALAVPAEYRPNEGVLARARERASGTIVLTHDPAEAVEGADVVNTDVWASMGREAESEVRSRVFGPFQVNLALLKRAAPNAVVLHCLPAHLGQEITEEVLEGPWSAVFDQAENRLHAQKALLEFLLKKQK
ncbi:MAG: ornithine carbamoyltransferase [Pseudomonadota bacterium]